MARPDLAALADDMGLLPGEVVLALNDEAAHWQLAVQRDGLLVRFYVAGEVYPHLANGRRARRGKVPFYGDSTTDATRALYNGLLAAREVAS